ncbi:radical SAM/SPASM domain-containing protein [Paenibacillus sp. IHBB 10380]|uniref:radical SAM/SPASM domain-containing protein n=1 Tax=Paenibacillus sp. IHBB 10380 TaxID=1566358 RepID=UPI0005CFB288|nr:radical SAM/SPASM domain-containing protein [Paenibacillus sp. IHBB 10380]AJS57206.1 hypothetical protein UB51_00335 [Paenibacillus sp. IHBB 10380]
MLDLSKTTILSFEIGDDCNLQKCHKECPINARTYLKQEKHLTVEKIVESINQAKDMNFNGFVAFHNYNEPLLHKDKLLEIIEKAQPCKYLLWTNGLLLNRNVEKNEFLKKFDFICITCYFKKDISFFEQIKEFHGNVHIFDWELDDRLDAYSRDYFNEIGCKRPLFELPIDYYGNVHLCCFDWNNTYEIGNINDTSLTEIVNSDTYQNILASTKKKLLDRTTCPEICKNCNHPWISYTKYYDIYYGQRQELCVNENKLVL